MSLAQTNNKQWTRRAMRVAAAGTCIALAPFTALAQTAAPAAPANAATVSTLPGGAQAINEAFQDWTMTCVQPAGGKRCAITQQQADAKTRQRLIAVELQPIGDKAEGVLVLPFGLLLDKGVTLKAGATELGALRFKTCLPQGCVVPLTLDAKALTTLRGAKDPLTVTAFNDAGGPLAFAVSVNGFGPALNRAAALGK
ncbi:invasion associated locus B family protein [Hyphomicrobium sp. D-2]|uniref:invasion associated locus B family protein n=1 Tax=Hyphomicrobium sp. D-2 TaxID=3041621 RepID=UPI00245850DF|nr:invasion associated locus B family protein [Hyphomicrobium sp. D-2]MDH4982412.1 invasion associated locus B family protein [Hyphomicrobium sp. D-2]